MMQMFGPAQSYVFEDDGNLVILKWVAGGPWDYYRQAGSTASGPESPGGTDTTVVGTTWQWEEFHETDGGGHGNPNAEAYTLTLLPDGTASIQADCNQVQWTYTMEGDAQSSSGTLSFDTFGPSTLAFCPEPSLSELYLGFLGNVATYVLDGGRLFLNLQADGGNMVFGAAEEGDLEDVIGDFALSPDQISLDTEALGTTWQAVVVEETPYDESMPPGPVGLPTHIEILFGDADPADVLPGDPIMYIIPVNSYRKMWDEAGNDAVTRTIQEIQQLNFVLTSPAPTSGYPVLPFEQAVGYNDLAVQVGKAISQAELNNIGIAQ
jgi:heat shock protein HslJ